MLVKSFADLGVEVVLGVEHRPHGGVALVGRDIYWHGVRLPRTALRIEFASRVFCDAGGGDRIEVVGRLTMDPRTAARFILHTVLRRPRELGSIRYELRLEDCGPRGDRVEPGPGPGKPPALFGEPLRTIGSP